MNPHLVFNERYGTALSYIIWLLTYLIGGFVAYVIYPYVDGQGPVMAALWMNIAATMVIFIASCMFNNASLYDAYWSIGPVFTVLFWWSLLGFDTLDVRKMLAFVAVSLWSIRLTSNWVRGWPGLHYEDWRFQNLRAKTGALYPIVNLTGIQLFQTGLIFMGSLPLFYVMAFEHATPLNCLDVFGFLVSVAGATLELVADEQLKQFKKKNPDPVAFMDRGTWYYSRHPNYFGEFLFWLGLYIMALGAGLNNYWTGIGSLAIFCLFQFVSIPMMDERMVQKRPLYAAHMITAARFIPWFRK